MTAVVKIINWDKHLSSFNLNTDKCYNCSMDIKDKNDYIYHLYGPTSCVILEQNESKNMALSAALLKYGSNILKYSV